MDCNCTCPSLNDNMWTRMHYIVIVEVDCSLHKKRQKERVGKFQLAFPVPTINSSWLDDVWCLPNRPHERPLTKTK